MTSIRTFDNAAGRQLRKIVMTAALLGLAAGIGRTQSAEDLRNYMKRKAKASLQISLRRPVVETPGCELVQQAGDQRLIKAPPSASSRSWIASRDPCSTDESTIGLFSLVSLEVAQSMMKEQ